MSDGSWRRYRATVRAVKRGAATNLRPSYTTIYRHKSVTFTIGEIDVCIHEGSSVHWYRRQPTGVVDPYTDRIGGCTLNSWRLRRALRRHMPNASEFPGALGGATSSLAADGVAEIDAAPGREAVTS